MVLSHMDLCWAPWETVCNQSPAWALGVVLRNALKDFERSDSLPTDFPEWHTTIFSCPVTLGIKNPLLLELHFPALQSSLPMDVCVWQYVTKIEEVKKQRFEIALFWAFSLSDGTAGFVLCCHLIVLFVVLFPLLVSFIVHILFLFVLFSFSISR